MLPSSGRSSKPNDLLRPSGRRDTLQPTYRAVHFFCHKITTDYDETTFRNGPRRLLFVSGARKIEPMPPVCALRKSLSPLHWTELSVFCLLYTSPSPRDGLL